MVINTPYYNKILRIVTISALAFMVCWGLVLVLAKLRPFWTDEWRLIYNLKFRSTASLWGPLDYTQQCPRVYLQAIKAFTGMFGYSYFSLRLPSFLVGTATIIFSYKLMNQLYKPDSVTRFILVFLVISSVTFTDYFVQVKQYTMEILLSIVAIWQMAAIIRIGNHLFPHKALYAVLCASFFAAPFFSYTYPIAASPVFIVAFFQGILQIRKAADNSRKMSTLLLQWIPLVFCAAGILLFYKIDASKVMGDTQMHGYWNYRMITGGTGFLFVTGMLWDLFKQLGTGFIFEIILGILGICAFAWNIFWLARNYRKPVLETIDWIRLYSILVVAFTIVLFFAGKMPIEPKFNVFATASMAILIIWLMDYLLVNPRVRTLSAVLLALLYVEMAGNLVTSAINQVTASEYVKRMNIYRATEKAIIYAQENKFPIMVTPGVAYPDEITKYVPNFSPISAAAVLKTFPAYSNVQNLPVYSVDNLSDIEGNMRKLPGHVKAVLADDGLTYTVVAIKD